MKATKAEDLGVDQEGSAARTEAPASDPLYDVCKCGHMRIDHRELLEECRFWDDQAREFAECDCMGFE